MHAALPVQMEDVFAVGLIGIDDDLVEHRAQDPFLQVVRGVRMMPHSREVVAELKQVLPLLGGQDRLRAGERGEVRFEPTDAGEGIVPPDFELAGDQVRSSHKGRHTTATEHMPEKHRQMGDWTPDRFIRWAEKIGPATAALITAVLNSRRHPQHAYRSCLGLLRLAKCHGDARPEAAATRALPIGSYSYRSVESILKHRLDETSAEQFERADPVEHDNAERFSVDGAAATGRQWQGVSPRR